MTGVRAVLPATGITVHHGPERAAASRRLLDALAGLLPLSGGEVTADGHRVGGPAWQEQVAWLPQRPHFVRGTIADNLRLGRPDAAPERLWTALRQVALEERVRALPQGLESPLGEDGTTLSAGERARLALARVVVADRPWMLLDEPTAHLDELTEKVITDTLVELGRRGAVVVVAHRPALVAVADQRLELPAPPAQAEVTPGHPPAVGPTARPVPLPDESVVLPVARFGVSTVLAALASAAGVALTATAGWLIVQASTRPAVLTLLVAIVGVRAFGLARPVLRYAERLRSHDVALRLLARRRVEVYDAVVPLTPGRLGRRRGDLLTSIVDDVDSVVDRELRVRMPGRSYAIVVALATAAALLLQPAAAMVIAGGAIGGGLGAWTIGRRGAATAERVAVALRADLAARVVEVVQLSREHRMWQAADRCAEEVTRVSNGLGAAATTATAMDRRCPSVGPRRGRRHDGGGRAGHRTGRRGRHVVRTDDGAASAHAARARRGGGSARRGRGSLGTNGRRRRPAGPALPHRSCGARHRRPDSFGPARRGDGRRPGALGCRGACHRRVLTAPGSRRPGGAGRGLGVGQEHGRSPAGPVPRPGLRRGPARRAGPPRPRPRRRTRLHRSGRRRPARVRDHGRRERAAGPSRRDR